MNNDFLKVAKQAALEAGKIALNYFGKEHALEIKGGDSSNFATVADLEAEKRIIKIIKDNFPNHSFIAEESGGEGNSEYTWVIDPIDGTAIFSAGLPYFTVSIGLLKDKKPLLGVIYQPVTKDFYWAISGKGAFINNKMIRVSNTNNLENAVLGVDFAHRAKRMEKTQKYVLPLINKVRYPISLGSDVLIFAFIGKGILDGFATETNIWDCISGAVIITEAGGEITDSKGLDIDWSKKRMEIIASNGFIHDQILDLLKDGKI